ncbi:UNKNOWN [Stylonychia lemnae]|uniref:Uncharacterized protein n=1 Tax=Stylonychia lemnae TaxID=5949 RepID=A0A078B3P6_STYLE|nr:UNKNOWN [Stylonychia lemnae]|eukprot:CDW89079.1 UNKNOWN [Stylonychia lemnae]
MATPSNVIHNISLSQNSTFQYNLNTPHHPGGLQISADLSSLSINLNSNEQHVVSPLLIESMIYQSLEKHKKEIFLYARKEVLYNENHNLPQKSQKSQYKISEFDALYDNELYQPSDNISYQQVYIHDYEKLLTKISEQLTLQVNDLVQKMIENMFQLKKQKELEKKSVSGRGLLHKTEDRNHTYSDIYEQMKKFQIKYEESKNIIGQMRKNYLKEISHLRAVEDVMFTNKKLQEQQKTPQGSKAHTSITQGHIFKEPRDTHKDLLEVYFFTPTEGLDNDTCQIFNKYFMKLKNDFETRLNILNNVNQDLSWKVALIDESKKISEMNSMELIEMVFTKEKDQEVIWQQIKRKFQIETLEQIAEDEFAEIINKITEKEITTQALKITEESKFQIQDAKDKLQKEISYLRLQISYKQEEIEKMKELKLLDIDRARFESYDKAERRFFDNLRLKEEKFQEEREMWKEKLETAVKDDIQKYNSLFLNMAMMKWRFIVAIFKLKNGSGDLNESIEETIKKVMDSQVNKYAQKLEKCQDMNKVLETEKQILKDEIDRLKYQISQRDDKIDLLLNEVVKYGDDNIKLQKKVEESGQFQRGLEDQLEQGKRDQSDFETLGNNVTTPGKSMSTIAATVKFNSKVYASKTLKAMIDDRSSALGNIYSSIQVNVATDTFDLIEIMSVKTQYKESHFFTLEQAEGQDLIVEQQKEIKFNMTEKSIVQSDEGIQTDDKWVFIDKGEYKDLLDTNERLLEQNTMLSQQQKKAETIVIPLENKHALAKNNTKPLILSKGKQPRIQSSKRHKIFHPNQSNSSLHNLPKNLLEKRNPINIDIEDQLDDISLDNSDIYYQNIQNQIQVSGMPQMNDEVLKKAMHYIQNKELRQYNLRTLQNQTNVSLDKLPQVYKRLWDDVAAKNKKSKELQLHFDKIRQLEWIKLLQSKNHLNLKDKKNQEKIKEIFELMQNDILIRGDNPQQNHNFNQVQQVNLNQVIDLFSQEQEQQYQSAIRKWEAQQQSKLSKSYQFNQASAPDIGSVYITEQPYIQNIYQQDPLQNYDGQMTANFQQLICEDKMCQTDSYLLEQFLQKIPNYQVRMNQFLYNKQSNFSHSHSKNSLQHSRFQTTADFTNANSSVNNSITLNNNYQQVNDSYPNRKKPNLFMNSRIRQASHASKQRGMLTQANSPKHNQQQNYGFQSNSALMIDNKISANGQRKVINSNPPSRAQQLHNSKNQSEVAIGLGLAKEVNMIPTLSPNDRIKSQSNINNFDMHYQASRAIPHNNYYTSGGAYDEQAQFQSANFSIINQPLIQHRQSHSYLNNSNYGNPRSDSDYAPDDDVIYRADNKNGTLLQDNLSDKINILESAKNSYDDQDIHRTQSIGPVNVPRLPTVIVNPQKQA